MRTDNRMQEGNGKFTYLGYTHTQLSLYKTSAGRPTDRRYATEAKHGK